jgi:hypothetical protein
MYENDLRGDGKWKKTDVFTYEHKPMFLSKKERKTTDASYFGPSKHPSCDPHAPRTPELPKHTAAM